MKIIFTAILFISNLLLTPSIFAEKVKTANKTTVAANKKLEKDTYIFNKDDQSKQFKIKEFGNLKLTEDCFQNAKSLKPNCEAYTAALIKIEDSQYKQISPYHNHQASLHCELIGGKNVIAKTSENNDMDFCLFKDGSMVSSWSAFYYKKEKK